MRRLLNNNINHAKSEIMKKKNSIWIYSLIVIGFVLILTNSCKKGESKTIPETVTDKDGNVYSTVTIGSQVWMAENLKTTKYRNGDLIGTTTPATKDISGESTPKYQWACRGNETEVAAYGRLYTWYAVTDSRNVCPSGWHLPSDAEWTTLTTYLGGESVAGGKLKAIGTGYWDSPNTGANNQSGFTALPGGVRGSTGSFYTLKNWGGWWSSTVPSVTTTALFRHLDYYDTTVEKYGYDKRNGISVRCVWD
jgi:uncharacterized protein (TIGR02145 family)